MTSVKTPPPQVPMISPPAFLSQEPGPQSFSQTRATRSHQQPELWDSCSWSHLNRVHGPPTQLPVPSPAWLPCTWAGPLSTSNLEGT